MVWKPPVEARYCFMTVPNVIIVRGLTFEEVRGEIPRYYKRFDKLRILKDVTEEFLNEDGSIVRAI